MINPHDILPPQQTQHPRRKRHTLQRRPHPRALRVADTIDIVNCHAGFFQCLLDQSHDPGAVVFGRVLWEEARARWGDKGVPDVGEDLCGRGGGGFGGGGLEDDADAEFVRGAFEADCDHV